MHLGMGPDGEVIACCKDLQRALRCDGDRLKIQIHVWEGPNWVPLTRSRLAALTLRMTAFGEGAFGGRD